jgi:hypothetical protein
MDSTAEPILEKLEALDLAPARTTEEATEPPSLPKRPRFGYHALPHPDSIRLVKIHAHRPQIKCEIKIVRLSDAPLYEALSYCWGQAEETTIIICNGATLDVSPTLRYALKNLYYYGEDRWFWMDQISINQNDSLERTQQVRLMKSIYAKSIRTIISLPLHVELATAAKSLIRDIWLYIEEGEGSDAEDNTAIPENSTTESEGKRTLCHLPSDDDDRWLAFTDLMELPWFERCWIVQEVVLSKESPRILCGDEIIQWSRLEKVARWLYSHTAETGWGGHAMKVNHIALIGETDDDTDDILWDLQSLFMMTNLCLATNPRDRIFALLGLCKDTQDVNQWPAELTPDYEKPLIDLFTNFTRYCVRQTKSLDLLERVYSMDNSAPDIKVPSWVFHWDARPGLHTYTGTSWIAFYSGWAGLEQIINRASKDLVSRIDDTASSSILRLRGILFSTAVHFCSPIFYDDVFGSSGNIVRHRPHFQPEVCALLQECGKALPHMYKGELHRAFFMATTMGVTLDNEDAQHESLVQFEAYLQPATAEELTPNEDTEPELGTDRDLPNTKVSQELPILPDPSRYALRLHVMINRRLFTTASGHLGLGPSTMEPKDVIAVLFGGKVPFVLRPLGNGQWRFIGPCYVHGIMKGEALDGEEGDESRHKWFELV